MTMTGKKIYNSDTVAVKIILLDKFAEMMIEKIKTLQNDWKKPWFTDKSISWYQEIFLIPRIQWNECTLTHDAL